MHDFKTIVYFADPIPLTDLDNPLALLRAMGSQKLFLILLNRGNWQLEIVNMDSFERQIARLWAGKKYLVGDQSLGIPIVDMDDYGIVIYWPDVCLLQHVDLAELTDTWALSVVDHAPGILHGNFCKHLRSKLISIPKLQFLKNFSTDTRFKGKLRHACTRLSSSVANDPGRGKLR